MGLLFACQAPSAALSQSRLFRRCDLQHAWHSCLRCLWSCGNAVCYIQEAVTSMQAYASRAASAPQPPLGRGSPGDPLAHSCQPGSSTWAGKRKSKVLKVCLGVLLYLEQCRASMLRVYVLASPHSPFFSQVACLRKAGTVGLLTSFYSSSEDTRKVETSKNPEMTECTPHGTSAQTSNVLAQRDPSQLQGTLSRCAPGDRQSQAEKNKPKPPTGRPDGAAQWLFPSLQGHNGS